MRRWLGIVLRLGVGGLFGLAGAMKLADSAGFAIEIHNYQVFPVVAPVLAATLPTVELAAAAAILLGPREWRRAGAAVAALLLAVFTIAVASVVARGINVSCGCFGTGSGPVTIGTVLRDVLLLAAAVALFRLSSAERPPYEATKT